MSLPVYIDEPVQTEWHIYDANLMELSDPHPRLSKSQEADLKGRLLEVISARGVERDPAELTRLFREALGGGQ